MHPRSLGLVVLTAIALVGLALGSPRGQPAHAQEAIDPAWLGTFQFIADGEVEFALTGDGRVTGRVTKSPSATSFGLLTLIGMQTPFCPAGGSTEATFELSPTIAADATATVLTGIWRHYNDFSNDIDGDRVNCNQIGEGPVTVTFTTTGAIAEGNLPPGHQNADLDVNRVNRVDMARLSAPPTFDAPSGGADATEPAGEPTSAATGAPAGGGSSGTTSGQEDGAGADGSGGGFPLVPLGVVGGLLFIGVGVGLGWSRFRGKPKQEQASGVERPARGVPVHGQVTPSIDGVEERPGGAPGLPSIRLVGTANGGWRRVESSAEARPAERWGISLARRPFGLPSEPPIYRGPVGAGGGMPPWYSGLFLPSPDTPTTDEHSDDGYTVRGEYSGLRFRFRDDRISEPDEGEPSSGHGNALGDLEVGPLVTGGGTSTPESDATPEAGGPSPRGSNALDDLQVGPLVTGGGGNADPHEERGAERPDSANETPPTDGKDERPGTDPRADEAAAADPGSAGVSLTIRGGDTHGLDSGTQELLTRPTVMLLDQRLLDADSGIWRVNATLIGEAEETPIGLSGQWSADGAGFRFEVDETAPLETQALQRAILDRIERQFPVPSSVLEVELEREGAQLLEAAGGLPGAEEPEEDASCDCSCTVVIEGPESFGICCMEPVVSLHQVEEGPGSGIEVHTPEGAEMRLDPSRIHLDADVAGEDGWNLFDAFYAAKVEATCNGGGRAVLEEASYEWEVQPVDGGFDLAVTVTAPVDCPGASEHPPVTAATIRQVRYTSEPCEIKILIQRTGLSSISHVDIEINCGSYRELFGYYPLENARDLASTLSGVDGLVERVGTRVLQNRHGWTSVIADEIGQDYETSHAGISLTVYTVTPEDCSVCLDLRRAWEELAANPGTYWLLGSNCATNAYDVLTTSGALPALPFGARAPIAPTTLEQHIETSSSTTAPISGPEYIR